jgi:hypothetical protein
LDSTFLLEGWAQPSFREDYKPVAYKLKDAAVAIASLRGVMGPPQEQSPSPYS